MSEKTTSAPEREYSPSAAVLAWLWPGLGHIRLGERRRGLLIMFGVLFLFFSGLLVGGLECVDRKNDRLWFLAQSLCGPIALAADMASQSYVQDVVPLDFTNDARARAAAAEGDPQLQHLFRRVGIGRVNEMGTLFVALAGLMNLVVILDAFYYLPKPQPERRRSA